MTTSSSSVAAIAAARSSVSAASADPAARIVAAARLILPHLERGRRVDAATLRIAMDSAFSGSDAEGAWDWKTAYDTCEAATVLFLRKFGVAMRSRAGSPSAMLPMLAKIAGLLPTHTRRSEKSETLQQFSTPIALGLAVSAAAAMAPSDIVLEPSAGTGLLALFTELSGAELVLNELADTRAGLLSLLFPAVPVTRFDAAHIDDHLDAGITPSVVLMNPPFSAVANVDRRMADAALRHISSALARLADGGRLVAITGANCAPDNPVWREAFVSLQERGRIVFSAGIDWAVYARHGTTTDTRLTVIDKRAAADPATFPLSPGTAPDVATLLGWITNSVPSRLPVSLSLRSASAVRTVTARAPKAILTRSPSTPVKKPEPEAIELAYETIDWKPVEGGRISDALYEAYGLQSIRIPGAHPHPTKLVQSAAMASVAPPKPSYRPRLPANVIENGLLSDAQLETVISAGQAHSRFLAGSWTVGETFDVVAAARDEAETAVRFRLGFMLGDGTGAGKGRQTAGILLDNWLKGRRKAVWISKSDKLIEDAQRDWSALGQERLLVTPLSRFRQGMPIRLEQGILFTTYATLRSDVRDEKVSRVKQIVEWLGADFDGVIIFDESHAMQNAAGGKANAVSRLLRSRAAPDFACNMPCRTRASSTSRRPAPPRFIISPMPSVLGSGVARTFHSRRASSLSRRSLSYEGVGLPSLRFTS
jgi:predicted RNA methylase